tara:strand:- start:507 stop:662 length:156 start_codon:yes stop_codon:yes gene_type:complete
MVFQVKVKKEKVSELKPLNISHALTPKPINIGHIILVGLRLLTILSTIRRL